MTKGALSSSVLFVFDLVICFCAVFLGKHFQRLLPELCLPDKLLTAKACIFTTIAVSCYYFQDLYNWKYMRKISEIFSSILLSGGATLIMLAAVYYTLPFVGLERDVLIFAMVAALSLAFSIRAIYIKLKFSSYAGTNVIILGDGENAKLIMREIRHEGHPVNFEGYIGRKNWDLSSRHLGEAKDLEKIIRKIDPDRLVVAPDGWRGSLPIDQLLKIKLGSCEVSDAPTFYEEVTGKILIEDIRPSSMIFAKGFFSTRFQNTIKRGFDVFFAIVGLSLSSPIMLITALAIRIDTQGPVFYRQERVGKGGRDFKLIKFRSMVVDAETNGPQWASKNDPRVTKVGKFIRKTRIDELPQFINVIKNEMSFVGPRPERKYFIDQLEELIPYYELRLHLKPGITGWAQVNYSYGDTVDDAKEKLKYELYYAKNRSFWLDLVIIFQTIKVAVKGRGSQ